MAGLLIKRWIAGLDGSDRSGVFACVLRGESSYIARVGVQHDLESAPQVLTLQV